MSPQDKIVDITALSGIRERHDRIVVCSGCYDILQSGHAVYFQQCKEFGDILLVVVGRDSAVGKQKPGRPINPQNNRMYLVASLYMVDYVILGEKELWPGKIDYHEIICALKPDVLVVNNDDSGIVEKRAFCEKWGIQFQTVSRIVPDFLAPTSSTEIILKSCKR